MCDMSNLRSWKGCPVAWYDKLAARYIRATCEPFKNELAVYIALCEIASNRHTEEFIAGLEEIGHLCSIHGRKTLGPVIAHLEELQLIKVKRSKLRAPSRFTMLHFEAGRLPLQPETQ